MTTMSSPPTPTRELPFGVNADRLLGEVGLFFSSATAAFAECVQNAYRAGATQLRVTANPDARTVVFRDNGDGCVDPTRLLLVAESGWDTTKVKHAAGMGSLALFAIASEVEILSMPRDGSPAWRMHFTDAALRGEERARVWDNVDRSHWAEGGDEQSGVEIRATLRDTATFPAMHGDQGLAWRHRFPLAITVEAPNPKRSSEIVRETYTVAPYTGFHIDTPVGALHVVGSHGWRNDLVVEWEHRHTGTVSLANELFETPACAALAQPVRSELLDVLRRNISLVWVVSSDAAVEAKLPDRETLVRDEGFRDAIDVLARALLVEFDVPNIREHLVALANGATVIEPRAIERAACAVTTFRRRFGAIGLGGLRPEPFLALAGYRAVTGGTPLTDVSCYLARSGDDVEFEVEYDGTHRMVLPEYVTPFAEIAVEAGLRAVAHDGDASSGTLTPLRIAFGESLVVPSLHAIFARELRFVTPDGATVAAVPVSLFESAWDEIDAPDELAIHARWEEVDAPLHAVFAVPDDGQPFADAVMALARSSEAVVNYATLMAGTHRGGEFTLDIWDYVEDDDSWEPSRIRADAVRAVAAAVGGDHVARAEHIATLIELENLLDTRLTRGVGCSRSLSARRMRG